MTGKIVRNKDYTSPDTSYRGNCPRFNKKATLAIHLSGVKMAKHDLNLTYHIAGFECDLLNDTNGSGNTCRLDCPIIEAFKNSHSY